MPLLSIQARFDTSNTCKVRLSSGGNAIPAARMRLKQYAIHLTKATGGDNLPAINMTAVRVGKAARRIWRSELNGVIGMCVKDIPCPHNCTSHVDPLTTLSSGGYCIEGKFVWTCCVQYVVRGTVLY